MKKISGIGLVRFQKSKKEEEVKEKISETTVKTVSELIKEIKKKDMVIANLFNTVNNLNKEVAILKEGK